MRQSRHASTVGWIIGLLLVTALVVWPLASRGFFISDDGDWMIIRLSAFYQSLREGQFPVRFLGRLNFGYGYPVANFLYPGFLYVGSFIKGFGFSFVDTMKITLAGLVSGAVFCLFFWLRRRFHARSSFLGVVGFAFSPYLVFDLYTRGSVGEITAIFAICLALLTLDLSAWSIFPFAIAFLLISHNSLALLFFLLLCLYAVVTKRKECWPYVLLGVGMAAFFWLPALFDQRYVVFNAQTIARPSAYMLGPTTLFLFNIVPAISCVLFWITRKTIGDRAGWLFLAVFTIGVFMSTTLSLPIWNLSVMGKIFQFPYRFLSLGLIAGPWMIAKIFDGMAPLLRRKLIILFCFIWLVPYWYSIRDIKWADRPDGYYSTNEATTTVADEYMPRWVSVKPKEHAPTRMEFFQGRGNIVVGRFSSHSIEANIEAKEKSIVQINTLYYPGWGVEVDGQPAPIEYQNGMGVMRVSIAKGTHRLSAEFRETPVRLMADIVSLASGFSVVFLIFARQKEAGRKKRS